MMRFPEGTGSAGITVAKEKPPAGSDHPSTAGESHHPSGNSTQLPSETVATIASFLIRANKLASYRRAMRTISCPPPAFAGSAVMLRAV